MYSDSDHPEAGHNLRLAALVGLIVALSVLRLLPHPPNFTPILAVGLFGGAMFRRRWQAFGVPLLAMLASDFGIELLFGFGFHALLPVVYLCVAGGVGLGMLLPARLSAKAIFVSGLAVSVGFFIVTNFAVWATSAMYPLTAPGLLACYAAAIPFFSNTLLGTLVYSGLMFGSWTVLTRRYAALAIPAVE